MPACWSRRKIKAEEVRSDLNPIVFLSGYQVPTVRGCHSYVERRDPMTKGGRGARGRVCVEEQIDTRESEMR